jgi:hypothetical protein
MVRTVLVVEVVEAATPTQFGVTQVAPVVQVL